LGSHSRRHHRQHALDQCREKKWPGRFMRREVPVLLVEQNLAFCLALADRRYILEQGPIVHHDARDEFDAMREIRDSYLTLG